jgi:hypothetical protein
MLSATTPEAYGGFRDDLDVVLPPTDKPPVEKPDPALSHNPSAHDTKSKANRYVTLHRHTVSTTSVEVYSTSCLR